MNIYEDDKKKKKLTDQLGIAVGIYMYIMVEN